MEFFRQRRGTHFFSLKNIEDGLWESDGDDVFLVTTGLVCPLGVNMRGEGEGPGNQGFGG